MAVRQPETSATPMIVPLQAEGHVVLPDPVRQELEGKDTALLAVRIVPEGILLIPIPREDTWAYTPEQLERTRLALEDARMGRVRQMSEEDLLKLAGD